MCAALSACTPTIGDKCVTSNDCSTRGDRLCDTSQTDGYCTQFNCAKNGCPDDAACVLFNPVVPGCETPNASFNDRSGGYGSRLARSFCVATCSSDSDCRAGYVCGDPQGGPWRGYVLDDNKDRRGCLLLPTNYTPAELASTTPPPVCTVTGPAVPALDAGASDSGTQDAGSADAGTRDGGVSDAGDAGDAGDGG
jgi:hypothetical protein